jgi:hypothetical protein
MKLASVLYLTAASLAASIVIVVNPVKAKGGDYSSPIPEHTGKPTGNHGNPKPLFGNNHGNHTPPTNPKPNGGGHTTQPPGVNPTIYGPTTTVSPSFNPNNHNSAAGGNVGDVKSNSNSGGNTLNNGNHINLNGGSNTFNPNNTNNVSPHVQGGGGGAGGSVGNIQNNSAGGSANTGPVTNTNHVQGGGGGSANTGPVTTTNGPNSNSTTIEGNKVDARVFRSAPPIILPGGNIGGGSSNGTTVTICGMQVNVPANSTAGGFTTPFGGVTAGKSATGRTGNTLVGAFLASVGLTHASEAAYNRSGMTRAQASAASQQKPECSAPAPAAVPPSTPAVPVQVLPSERPVAPAPGRVSN